MRGPFIILALLCLVATVAADVATLTWEQAAGYRWRTLAISPDGKDGFSELDPARTGILFTNWLPEARYLTNQILLNGSGVAAGDIDGDGWCDLFFCGIDAPSALYRNLGGWKFQDITKEAGVSCAGQPSSGAVFADVNGDGKLDLLVNGVGAGTRLFLNQGKGRFKEATAEWGLLGNSGSSSLALADIDGDGYLDLYVANYRTTTFRDELNLKFKASVTNNHYEILAVNGRPVTEPDLVGRYLVDPVMGILENGEAHVLYHNDGGGKYAPLSWTNGTFLDEDGQPSKVPYDWGLSVMFRDLNGDGAPDIYVCNDFHSPDRIWINDGHGRFRAIARLAIRQTSIFSMGLDIADVDRDGFDDIFVADMLSRKHASRHVQLMDRRAVQFPPGLIDNRPQQSRNTLLWNRGDGTYAEIAQSAGLEASEWTWCPVFMDVDLDGYEDLLCVTGHLRDAQNIDIARRIEAMGKEKRRSRLEQLSLRKMFTRLEIPNLAFRNRGDLSFEECGSKWGFDSKKVSQGIALADLDNDGALDVVVNCLDDGPLILRNLSNHPRVAVRLRGLPPNTSGIGAKIKVSQSGLPTQSQEILCGGRYLSGDEAMRVFAAAHADSELTIEVSWRSGRRSVIAGARANRLYEIDETQAKQEVAKPAKPGPPWFASLGEKMPHVHVENEYDDFHRQPLLPHSLSQLGPGVGWFDLDGDGWEDLMIGSGAGGRLAVFRNDTKGGLISWNTPLLDTKVAHDQTAVVGWLDAAGKPMILAGSSNYEEGLSHDPAVLAYNLSGQSIDCVMAGQAASIGPLALADLDGHGQMVVFAGGRVLPGGFPEPVASRILRPQSGQFQIDEKCGAALAQAGLVSGAVWSDLDGDGVPELILACEAGPIRVFHYDRGELREITQSLGLSGYAGLWNSVATGDFDGDGRLDIVAGNWGRNTRYQSHQPIHWYYGDLDGDGTRKVVEAYADADLKKIVPLRDWGILSAAMPFIKERYQNYTEFSTAGVAEILGDRLAEMRDLPLNTFDSMVFMNRGGRFEAKALPGEAQFSPIFGLVVADFDGDGNEDLIAVQNFFELPPQVSRLDGGRGVLLQGDGQGGFKVVPGQNSGLAVYGEGRGAAVCDFDHDGRADIVVAQNGNATQVYRNRGAKVGLRVRLQGDTGNPAGIGAVLRLRYREGRLGPARELHAGSGYWSQDAATQVLGLGGECEAVITRWPGGKTTQTPVPAGAREVGVKLGSATEP
jgi:enediyne biosynthesis protein E4